MKLVGGVIARILNSNPGEGLFGGRVYLRRGLLCMMLPEGDPEWAQNGREGEHPGSPWTKPLVRSVLSCVLSVVSSAKSRPLRAKQHHASAQGGRISGY